MDIGSLYRIARGDDQAPYAFQRALAERDWPEALASPTGSGKTAGIVLGWANRRMCDPAAPRRLVYCLPMRSLVEQTVEAARLWFGRLAAYAPPGILPDPQTGVAVLMGGVATVAWREQPEVPAMLVGTQDMLLSRALMRGYGVGRAAWPLDFALLHADTQWVFDEVQAMGAGLVTSTQLEGLRRRFGTARSARSLWASATLDPAWLRSADFGGPSRVWRVPEDFPEDGAESALGLLMAAPKPVARLSNAPEGSTKVALGAYARALAGAVLAAHRPGTLTLVVVNTVDRAQALRREIARAGWPEARLALVHARFRPDDRAREMERLRKAGPEGLIAVATQAVEAGLDLSAATLVTELAPWSSLVQRFGRLNRYAEFGADEARALWVDLPSGLAAPYEPETLERARARLEELADARPSALGGPDALAPPRRVLRAKDLIDLFDTDPDLSGFDVDVSPYIRDAQDTDVRLFWRADPEADLAAQPRPGAAELCPAPIGRARDWLKGRRAIWRADPQCDSGWSRLDGPPWPGLELMIDAAEGGYDPRFGFDPGARGPVAPLPPSAEASEAAERLDGDPGSTLGRPVALAAHGDRVTAEGAALAAALGSDAAEAAVIGEACRWHDAGKAHAVFQDTMRRGLGGAAAPEGPLAKSVLKTRHARCGFRHELASALALLAVRGWAREADLAAYLVAAHHGKVRLSLRPWPTEAGPGDGRRFARGVWEGELLPRAELGGGVVWPGGTLTLAPMEIGLDPVTGASWSERARGLLVQRGPFRLAWLEAMVRLADQRASAAEARDG